MRFFVCLLFLIPGSLSACLEPVTGPKELVAASGSCLYIPCRYDLCRAGRDPQIQILRWLRRFVYDKERKEFTGLVLGEPPRTPKTTTGGDCALTLPNVGPDHAGVLGLRLVASPKGSPANAVRWMHEVTLNVTDTPPAPHLLPPDPAPLTHGQLATLGCWVPPACPEDTLTLTWEGPVSNAPGVRVEAWTPPDIPYVGLGTRLTFKPLWYHDGTFVNCTFRGVHGKPIAWASRELQVHYPPRDVRVEVKPETDIREGQEVTLSCRDKAKPPPHSYAWSLDGRDLPHTTARVVLGPVMAADGGSYRCRATNAAGEAESTGVILKVQYPPRHLRVEVTPVNTPHEGQEVTLSCRGAAEPQPHSYAWSLDGRNLPHTTAQVILGAVTVAHSGSYRCRATNSLGEGTSYPTTLEVYFPPRWAAIETPSPLPAPAGARLALRCALGPAHPPPFVQWRRDDDARWLAHGPALAFDADPARAASYRCLAWNDAGSALSPPLRVVVWYPPRAVRVLQHPGGPVLAGGGPVRLVCAVGGGEPPDFEVTWFKDGAELRGAPRDLEIEDPQPPDIGSYVCRARNAAGGGDSPPVTLDVRFAPREVQLEVTPFRGATEGTDVILGCWAKARPPPKFFEWFREGRPLGRTPQGHWVLRGVGTHQSGRYRCRVTNEVNATESEDVVVNVYHSTGTILRRTFLSLGVALSLLLALGTLGFFLRRRWRRQAVADEEPVVEPSRTFFLRRKKPLTPRSPRGLDDAVSYSSVTSPPGDAVVYTVLKRNEGAEKATEVPDYENVPPGPSSRSWDRDGTLVYATLALASSGTTRGHAGDVGDTVEYVALRH